MRRTLMLVSIFFLVCTAASLVPAKETRSSRNDASFEKGSMRVILRSGSFSLIESQGEQKIEMQGFDYLKEPGRPMIPQKESLFLLPPGARVVSLEVEKLDAKRLPGKYAIMPTPPLLPLANPPYSSQSVKKEIIRWEESVRVAYSDDRAYPSEVARIVGSGTLRKYSYVRIAFRPFTYHALSGRLIHHQEARIRIIYSLPDPKSSIAHYTEELLADKIADKRAAMLFVNFDDMQDLYEPITSYETSQPAILEHYDLVVITTADNVDAITASSFLDWKNSLGFDVRIILTTDPEVAGQPGSDLAERIRNFLRAYYGPWGIENVLLVGGYEDIPMRYCYPDPENHLHDPWNPGVGPGSVPTDAYYADLSLPDVESWDLDRDSFYGEYEEDNPDFLTEVNVGRIPTSINSRITYTLDKLVRYEEDTGEWKRNALHAGAVLFYENQDFSGVPFRDGAVCVDEIERNFMEGWSVSRYSEQSGLVPSTYLWPALTLTSFITDWNNGMYGIVNWAGHGWPDGVYRTIWSWDDGDGVPETDGSDGMSSEPFIYDLPILQDDYPSIVCAVSCDVGYPEPNGSSGNIGINLLTNPTRGAAASVMSSTRYAAVSRDWPSLPGGAESFCYEFNRYLISGPGGFKRLGEAVYESKFFVHVNYGWENNYEFRNMYNYNLYGDPSMDWRGAGTRTGNLIRSTEVWQFDPVTPPLSDILPLDPLDDLYITDFVAGDVDPDPANECPLVFYGIDGPVWLWISKTSSGDIQIDF